MTDSHAHSYLHMPDQNEGSLHKEVHYPVFSAGSSQTEDLPACCFGGIIVGCEARWDCAGKPTRVRVGRR